MSIDRVLARELQEPEPIAQVERVSAVTSRVAFVGALRAEESVTDAREHERPKAETNVAQGQAAHGDTLVVSFQPLTQSAGPILIAAQVVGVRLSELGSSTPHEMSNKPLTLRNPAQVQITVEVQSPDAGLAHACIRLSYGLLGPITVDLELQQGRIELRAAVSTSRAADALRSGEGALRQGLALSGLTLDSMQITVGRRRPASGPRPTTRRKEQGQEES